MTAALQALAERLTNASGPDREIDALMCVLFYDIPDPPGAFKLGVRSPARPLHDDWQVDCVNDAGLVRSYIPKPYTAYLDAITALIERVFSDREWGVFQDLENNRYTAQIGNDNWDEAFDVLCSHAPTPALALCLALVRAKAAQEKQEPQS